MSKNKQRKLTSKQRIVGILRVLKITYKTAPWSIFAKLIGAIINAVLPITITYYAALTTTALASAYSGDELAGGQAVNYVIIASILGLVSLVWGSIERYINQLVRYKIDLAVNDRLYMHFLSLDFWRYDDKHTADLFDKAQKFSMFFGYVFDNLARIVSQFIALIAGLIALLLVSWWLGLILIIAVIPGIIIQYKLSKLNINHWNKNVETRRAGRMIDSNMSNINMIAEMRLYGVIRHVLNLRVKLRDKDEKARIDFERKFIYKQIGSEILEASAEVIALLFTTFQIIARAQPIGRFLYVQQVVSRALGGARSFVSEVSSIDEDIANLFDYQEFMSLPTGEVRPIKLYRQPENIILEKVSFHYPDVDVTVIKNISMKISRGQHVAIVGENGAGKTTLIKLILGLYNPVSGRILLDEDDLKLIVTETWHKYLGVLQQEFARYYFATARENIYFGDVGSPLDINRFESALDNAEARNFLDKLPKGSDSYVNQWMEHKDGTSGIDLSGGQWQRLALARNFYRNSPIIILDEPTSAIDSLAESRIFKSLFADKKRTIITISHRLTTVEKADVIYMLVGGELVEQGTHKELTNLKGAYYHMFESQLRDTEK